jgi:hypothetical protein
VTFLFRQYALRPIKWSTHTVPVEKESEHASAFRQFIDSIRDDIFDNKKAFSMSFLLDKFCSFLPPPNIASKYTTSKMQQRLLNYFVETTIINQPNDNIKQAMWNTFTRFSDRNFSGQNGKFIRHF